jgi:predicted nuclease with TOPRIM domain
MKELQNELSAEIDRLRAENERLEKRIANQAESIRDFQTRVTELEEALIVYGDHLNSCSRSIYPSKPCDCEFTAMLESVRQK